MLSRRPALEERRDQAGGLHRKTLAPRTPHAHRPRGEACPSEAAASPQAAAPKVFEWTTLVVGRVGGEVPAAVPA
ncbi:hypothetical protein SAV31267_076240 [Streptomyces avermitilis]|uniref:Uncharacterized protein n=1 Tax=Streptomyces avermitilis TaxID=33903 RepID=A0A4D4N3U4_STRAX|nr:hypothetical protein SAVMC3_23660 [Streptomyces avermitilis]GDY78139.1 hypothetical protein SAV31267_076240 [Streptomyces avermitilis]